MKNAQIDFSTKELPRINDSVKFENLCLDLWKSPAIYELCTKNGRRGQNQDGVDIYARYMEDGRWLGIQCKVRANELSDGEIVAEINKAKNFEPSLSEYLILTTLPRDAKIQKYIRKVNAGRETPFSVEILFWEDIVEKLQNIDNLSILYKYYSDIFIDEKSFGYVVGKMLTLQLGIGNSLDSQYQLMIGKIPKYVHDNNLNNQHFRDCYFIGNMHERGLEFFREYKRNGKLFPSCFPSDIEEIFRNKFDCWRISKWIRSIHEIDDFIKDDRNMYEFFISEEEWEEHLSVEE